MCTGHVDDLLCTHVLRLPGGVCVYKRVCFYSVCVMSDICLVGHAGYPELGMHVRTNLSIVRSK